MGQFSVYLALWSGLLDSESIWGFWLTEVKCQVGVWRPFVYLMASLKTVLGGPGPFRQMLPGNKAFPFGSLLRACSLSRLWVINNTTQLGSKVTVWIPNTMLGLGFKKCAGIIWRTNRPVVSGLQTKTNPDPLGPVWGGLLWGSPRGHSQVCSNPCLPPTHMVDQHSRKSQRSTSTNLWVEG